MLRFTPNEELFLAQMCVKPTSPRGAECAALCAEAAQIARPRLIWRKRIQGEQALYPFVTSCGPEIIAWRDGFKGRPLPYFWADALAELALEAAITALEHQLQPLIKGKHLASVHPGDSPEWPLLEGQRLLFSLLGCRPAWLRLTRQGMMLPVKSLCGVYFGTDTKLNACALCLRQICEKRR